jgi:hypothetical protein
MKRFYQSLAGLLLLALFALPAEAAWNIRQKGSGGAVWTDGAVEVPVGSNGVLVPISTFQASATYFVPVHKSGNVVRMYVVNSHQWSGVVANPSFNVSVGSGTILAYTPISLSEANATFTILTTYMSFAGRVTQAVFPVTGQRVRQGEVIRVLYNAPSHGAAGINGLHYPGWINIVIE